MAIHGIGASAPVGFSLHRHNDALKENLERLASGKRVNKAADDAAGLAIAKQLLIDVGSVEASSRNVDFGISQSEIVDGALSSQGELVGRMRELAMQASNGTLSDSDRSAVQAEFTQLRDEVDRIAQTTEFNGNPLLQGGSTELQVGIDGSENSRLSMDTPNSSVAALGLDTLDLSSAAGARDALASLDSAIEGIATSRSDVGATRNRLDSVLANNAAAAENLAAAASRIADTDIAAESTQLTLNRVREAMSAAISKQGGLSAGLLVDLVA